MRKVREEWGVRCGGWRGGGGSGMLVGGRRAGPWGWLWRYADWDGPGNIFGAQISVYAQSGHLLVQIYASALHYRLTLAPKKTIWGSTEIVSLREYQSMERNHSGPAG